MSVTLAPESLNPLHVVAQDPQHHPATSTPQEIVLQASTAYIVSACLNAAVKLRIPDLIGSGIKAVRDLAAEAGADETTLFRVLRVLEMSHIVSRPTARAFQLTPAGQLLRRDSSHSFAAGVEWIADPLHLSLYGELQQSIETGATTFDAVKGEPFFEWASRPENADEAAVFNNAMTAFSEMCLPAFLDAYQFDSFKKIVDVGGGHGALLRGILKQNPRVRGAIAEMPSLVPNAKAAIAADHLTNRCDAVECNFFDSIPGGGDLYMMKNIIHDWADAPAIQLLKNIRAVISPDGKLLLAEAVIDDSPAPHFAKLLDIEMLAFVGGKERTAEEFNQLLAASGFKLQRIVATQSPLSLLEAVPA